jgi:hypothetical protein
MLLRLLFRNVSLFLLCYRYRSSIPLLRPILPSMFFTPFHQSLPLCILHLVFGFSLTIPLLFSSQFLAPLSRILPLKSPPKSIQSSLFLLIVSLAPLIVVFISLLTYCHYFPPFIAYMHVSFHTSFSFSLFLNPQFHPCYYSPGSSSFLLSLFCPLTFSFVPTLSVTTFLYSPSSVPLVLFFLDPLYVPI